MPKVAIIRNNFYFDDILNNNLSINPVDYNLNNEKYYQNKNIEFEENCFDFNLIKSKNNNLKAKKNIRNLFKI